MNSMPLPTRQIQGFKIVPKHSLRENFRPSQSAYYVLIGRRGGPEAPRERVLLVQSLDHFLDGCQRQIDELWEKHRVLITHVAVKLRRRLRHAQHNFADTYRHAIAVQQLRRQLHPRFRRV